MIFIKLGVEFDEDFSIDSQHKHTGRIKTINPDTYSSTKGIV